MNKAILHGNLGADPEVRYTESNTATTIANFSVATTYKDNTEWHRCVAFGQQAEVIGSHLKKGMKVLVEGRLQTRAWEDRNGIKRYTTEVIVERFEFSGPKKEEEPKMNREQSQRHVDAYSEPQIPDDDIPF